MFRAQKNTKDRPLEKLTVNELWSEVSRLKIDAPPRAKKASLQKLVREARMNEDDTRTTTIQTRGKKRKTPEPSPEFPEAPLDDAGLSVDAATAVTADTQNMEKRVNNMESTLIQMNTAIRALTEKLVVENTNGRAHPDQPQVPQNGLARPLAGSNDVEASPDAILDYQLSKVGLDRGPLLGLANSPTVLPQLRDGLTNKVATPGLAYNPDALSATPLEFLHAGGNTSYWQRNPQDPGHHQLIQDPGHHHQLTALTHASSTNQAYSRARQILAGKEKGIASHLLPTINNVTPHHYHEIISGRDFNLAKLLIPDGDDFNQKEILLSGGEAVPVQQRRDPRLNKMLSLPDFVHAYNIWYRVMIEQYPHRALELDQYRSNICELSRDFGIQYYQYHKLFSAKAAAALLNHGHKVDWSVIDVDLHLKVFAGRRANACQLCQGVDHPTDYCPQKFEGGLRHSNKSTAKTFEKTHKRQKLEDGVEICERHNNNRCHYGESCDYHHVCSLCHSKYHIKGECPKSTFKFQQNFQRPSAATGGQRSDKPGKK